MNIQKNVDLFPHTTLRMRARSEEFCQVRTIEEIIEVCGYARQKGMPLHLLGGGSNVALVSSLLKGLTIKNLVMHKKIISETAEFVDLLVSSGYPVTKIVNETVGAGYSGLEYQLGLPGTVGGAIYMNSKWTHPVCYFGDTLHEARLLGRDGRIKIVNRDYFHFRYDYSTLQETKEILLEGIFRLKKEDPAVLKNRAQESLSYRKKTQPAGVATLGCFFQNITEKEQRKLGLTTQSAGSLIDRAGLKNYSVGNFFVSPEHANFIINKGEGDPKDLAEMLATIKTNIREQFGIELREEVVVM